METAVWILCYFVSCFIISFIQFQFMDVRYLRTYNNRMIYRGAFFCFTVIGTAVNTFEKPLMNFISWLLLVGIAAYFLYYEENSIGINRIVESEAFLIVMGIEEGVYLIVCEVLLDFFKADYSGSLIASGPGAVFSKIIVIFINYFLLKKFRKGNPYRETGSSNSSAYIAVMLGFSFLNVFLMVFMFSYVKADMVFLSLSVSSFVLTDLYLLYYLRTTDEKKHYDEEMAMLKQQAHLQYEYYVKQEQKYNNTLRILHDVNRHVQAINDLSAAGNVKETNEYAEQIRDTLKPLIPVKYTENAILNILLSDKAEQAGREGIELSISMAGVDFGFMDSMDITTVFGNLLDNAIEACEAVGGRASKRIELTAKRFQEMVSVTMINDCNTIKWKGNMPVSDKGESRGIGLLNVKKCVEKYDGSISMKENNGKFITEFFLNS